MYQFPTEVASSGGLAFVLLYVLFAVLICIPLMIVEISMGQISRGSPVDAGFMSGNRRDAILGVSFIALLGVLAFYSSIEVTAIKYLFDSFNEPWYLSETQFVENQIICETLNVMD